ncbi:MAG: hypothetical protein IT317_13645 [Anaerolineales bacterium]|nr:hypothetical protein [Anaerolineales bacterium]
MAADAIPLPPAAAEPRRPGLLARLLARLRPVRLTKEERRELAAKKAEAETRRRLGALLHAECVEVALLISELLARRGVCYRTSQRGKEIIKKVRFFKPGYFYNEEALYLPVDLRPRHRPFGVGIGQLKDPEILDDLSVSIGRKVEAVQDVEGGFVYRVWRQEGVGGIPRHVIYDEMLALRPATIGPYGFPLGIGEGGKRHWKSLQQVQSLLIAGTTGSGKSNELHAILTTLIASCSERELQFALVDWKRVELSFYRQLKHVARFKAPSATLNAKKKKGPAAATAESGEAPALEDDPEYQAFATEASDTRRVFDFMVREMDRRMTLFEAGGVNAIAEYNNRHRANPLPYLYLVVEEWAQVALDGQVGKHCTEQLIRLASLGRAMGIGIIICTQYPSRVIDMRIRAVLNAVMSFNLPNLNASVATLGNKDAFRLSAFPGRFIWQFGPENLQIQAPRITPEKIREVVATIMGGKAYQAPISTGHDVTDTEILEWAVDKNDGVMGIERLAAEFAPRGFTPHHARRFAERMYGKTVTVFDQEYLVRRGGPNYPTRLVLKDPPSDTGHRNEPPSVVQSSP